MKRFILTVIGLHLFLSSCQPQSVATPAIIDHPEKSEFAPLSSQTPVPLPTQTATFTETAGDEYIVLDPALQELYDLHTARKANLWSQPGWVHLVFRRALQDRTPLTQDVLGLDMVMDEEWVYLDEQGLPTQAVIRLLYEDGKAIPVRILNDGAWRSLLLGRINPDDTWDNLDPGSGFYEHVSRLVQQGVRLNKQTIYNNCWYSGEEYSVLDGEVVYAALYHPGNQTLRTVRAWAIEQGAVVMVSRVDIYIEERVDQPPPEVLALLDSNTSP